MTEKALTRSILSIGHATSVNSLHEMLAASLDFPGYYGKNWNAFWDCITNPDQSDFPDILILKGFEIFREKFPGDADNLRRCLDDLQKQRPQIKIEFKAT